MKITKQEQLRLFIRGQRFKRRREHLGKTLDDVAREIRQSKSVVWKAENGHNITIVTFRRLQEALFLIK